MTIFHLSCGQWDKASLETETVKMSLLSQSCRTQTDGIQALSKNEKQPVFVAIFVKDF